jgi:hypothetical protein
VADETKEGGQRIPTWEALTRDEKSLLTFLECAQTDMGGRFHGQHTNEDDQDTMERWAEWGYLKFGRIAAEFCNPQGSHWVRLSPEAVDHAQRERRERQERMWAGRRYRTTEEA